MPTGVFPESNISFVAPHAFRTPTIKHLLLEHGSAGR